MARGWGYPARKHLFHHVRVCPEEVEAWLSRPPESVRRMAPHIVNFELSDQWTRRRGAPPFRWEDTESLLTRLISSLSSSPVQWLRIESFGISGFSRATLEQCFEPISHSLRSLELGNLTACPDATRYLISLFPNLHNLHIGNVLPTSTQPPSEWVGCGIKHSPKLSGTLQFFNAEGTDDSEFFASIASLSPGFRTISPGNITGLNWSAVRRLMEACTETVELVRLVWWQYASMASSGDFFTLLTTTTVGPIPSGFLSPCIKLRKIGFTTWDVYRGTAIQTALSSIISKHLSTVTLELAHPDWSLSYTPEEFRQWWGGLEDALCHLTDQCLANGQPPLVFEMVWWRPAGHKGGCGTTYPDTIMPKFREKGSILFAESDLSSCDLCADILAEGP